MDCSKNSTIQKEEDGHCTAIVPIWWVEDVHIQEHLPYHRGFITLLLPGNEFQPSSSSTNLNNKKHS
jgi:hypothetical protein